MIHIRHRTGRRDAPVVEDAQRGEVARAVAGERGRDARARGRAAAAARHRRAERVQVDEAGAGLSYEERRVRWLKAAKEDFKARRKYGAEAPRCTGRAKLSVRRALASESARKAKDPYWWLT